MEEIPPLQLSAPAPVVAVDSKGKMPSCYLTARNFHEFQWHDLRLLIIEDVVKEVLPQMLKFTQNSILTIELMGLTLFKNIPLLLSHCSNLVCLIFSNIVLNGNCHSDSSAPQPFENSTSSPSSSPSIGPSSTSAYFDCSSPLDKDSGSDYTTSKSIIKLPQLVRITFNGMGELSLDEILILRFLTQRTECKALKILSFEPKQNRNPSNQLRHYSITMSGFNPADNDGSIALAKFLKKNSSIKNIVAERNTLSLAVMEDEKSWRKTEDLQLQELTCSMRSAGQGFENLLRSQTSLEILNCFSTPSSEISNYESILDLIQRCCRTLKTIRISHKVAFSGIDQALENVPEFVDHDCKVYKDCEVLAHLSLSLSISNDPARRRMKPGAIINPNFFPVSIKTLIVRFDVMNDEQMELFVQRLPSLNSLSLCLLYGNSDSPFRVNLKCLRILTELPKIQIFEMNGCLLVNWDEIQNFILSTPHLVGRLEVTPESCTFWRNH